jgi:hypothetical protein
MKPTSKNYAISINTQEKLAALAAAVTVLVAGAAIFTRLAERSAKAFPNCGGQCNIQPFGMVGIAPGQTARLNVIFGPDNGQTPATIRLSFNDASGNRLLTRYRACRSRPASRWGLLGQPLST